MVLSWTSVSINFRDRASIKVTVKFILMTMARPWV